MRAACVARPAEFASPLPRVPRPCDGTLSRTLLRTVPVSVSPALPSVSSVAPPTQAELLDFVRRTAADAELIDSLPLDPEGRTWVRLEGPGGSEAWLIGWPPAPAPGGTTTPSRSAPSSPQRASSRRTPSPPGCPPTAGRPSNSRTTWTVSDGCRPARAVPSGSITSTRSSTSPPRPTRSPCTPTTRRSPRSAATAARPRSCGWSTWSGRRTGSERLTASRGPTPRLRTPRRRGTPSPPLLLQRLPDHPQGHALGVALAGEHAREATQPLVAVEPTRRAQLAVDELPGRLLLLLGVELRDGRVDQCGVDTLGAQFLGERPPGEPPAVVPGLHPCLRERAVVDQSDLLEPRQHLLGGVVRDLPLAQGVGELLTRPRGPGEQAQTDRPRPLHRVRRRLPLLGPRQGGAASVLAGRFPEAAPALPTPAGTARVRCSATSTRAPAERPGTPVRPVTGLVAARPTVAERPTVTVGPPAAVGRTGAAREAVTERHRTAVSPVRSLPRAVPVPVAARPGRTPVASSAPPSWSVLVLGPVGSPCHGISSWRPEPWPSSPSRPPEPAPSRRRPRQRSPRRPHPAPRQAARAARRRPASP